MKLDEVLFIPPYQKNETEKLFPSSSKPRARDLLPKPDFFSALTKYNRILAGVPQEYGFHDHNEDGFRGKFCVGGAKGHVKKSVKNGIAIYTCVFPDDNIQHKHRRHIDIADAVKRSAPEYWRHVSLAQLKKDKDACYAIETTDKDGDGDVDVIKIYVRCDDHDQLTHY